MPLRFFAIPALDPVAAEAELNALLAAGRMAGVERQFVAAGAASCWSVIVTLADGPSPLPAGLKVRSERRTDYREVLSEPDFAVFARLRILRKQVADALACIEAVRTAGWASEADCQRAWDASLATLSGCESLGFRRRVLAGFGYSLEPGCPSN